MTGEPSELADWDLLKVWLGDLSTWRQYLELDTSRVELSNSEKIIPSSQQLARVALNACYRLQEEAAVNVDYRAQRRSLLIEGSPRLLRWHLSPF
jgi:hypothetical protein